MREGDRYYETTPFKELRDLAILDWPTFVSRVGEDVLLKAVICSLVEQGYTMKKIAIRYNLTKRKVQWTIENKCRCLDNIKK